MMNETRLFAAASENEILSAGKKRKRQRGKGRILCEAIVRVVVHLACFALALYAMQALNYEKLIRKGRVVQAQLLYILTAMCIALLAAQFLLNLVIKIQCINKKDRDILTTRGEIHVYVRKEAYQRQSDSRGTV